MRSALASATSTSSVRAVNFVRLNRQRPESTPNPRHRRRRRRRRRRRGPLARSRPRPRWPRITSYWPSAVAEAERRRRRDAEAKRPRAWFVLPAGLRPGGVLYERAERPASNND